MSAISSVGVLASTLNQSDVIQDSTFPLIWGDLDLESKMRFLDKVDPELRLDLGGKVCDINQKISDYQNMPKNSRVGNFMAGVLLVTSVVAGAIGWDVLNWNDSLIGLVGVVASIALPTILKGNRGLLDGALSCGAGYLIAAVLPPRVLEYTFIVLPVIIGQYLGLRVLLIPWAAVGVVAGVVAGLASMALGEVSHNRELAAKKTEVDSLRQELEVVLGEHKDALISQLRGRVEVLTTELRDKKNALKALKDAPEDFTVESALPKIQEIETARSTLRKNEEILGFLQGLK